MKLTRKEAEQKLHAVFGIERFYDEQWDAIKELLNGNGN